MVQLLASEYHSPEARARYACLAELLDELPLVGVFIRDKRDSEHRRDPLTGDYYKGMAPLIAMHVRAPQDAQVELLWTETSCDEQS